MAIDSLMPVIDGYHNQVKNLSEVEQSGKTMVAIIYVSKTYGARVTVGQEVLDECVNIFLDNFCDLGINEITEAYRMWSMGKLTIQGSAEMYGGEFNAAQFAKIMAGYVEYRKQITSAYIDAREVEKYENQKKEAMKIRMQKNMQQFLEEFSNKSFADWTKIPGWWYDVAKERGLINIEKKRAFEIWEQAKKIADIQIAKENNETDIFKRVLGEALKKKTQERAKVIAGQIAVFEYRQNVMFVDNNTQAPDDCEL